MKFLGNIAGAVIVLTAGAAIAAPAASGLIGARKANFKEIGGAFKAINDEIKSGAPDLNAVRSASRELSTRATASLKYFPKGSGPQAGVKTRAKAAIWAQGADFAALQKQFVGQANALNAAAASGNVPGMTAARNALGATCKSCHDKFREAE